MISSLRGPCPHSRWKTEEAISNYVGEWILNAWGRISSETTVAGFKKCCISNALDGTEDDFLWQHNEYENDKSDCGEDDNGEEKSENENFKRKPQFPENVLNSLCK
jgi:hypothetical protein